MNYWGQGRIDSLPVIDGAGEGEMEPYSLLQPQLQTVPLVFNSPHSGRYYPQSFIDSSVLDEHSIRQSEDYMVDQLFTSVVDCGAPILCANYARAYLDVNREAYELDPKMFLQRLPDFANTRSLRVAGGLGTVARIVSETQDIYRGKLDVDEVIGRIDRIYKPYHQTLRNLLDTTHAGFGHAVLIDCHSMPSAKDHNRRNLRPDFVIGDRYGSSAGEGLVYWAKQILVDMGYDVAVNKPYAGGYITEHYGRPDDGFHAVQIEINRSLYMNESAMCANDGFDEMRGNMEEFVHRLMAVCDLLRQTQFPLAAE
ncbi:MAG: N-formylglutamate amidohydrolase [Rhizobiaceae bacterium]|nr:N-formylglutamate amidohydrolase [Rhizobiaceae bacterium]